MIISRVHCDVCSEPVTKWTQLILRHAGDTPSSELYGREFKLVHICPDCIERRGIDKLLATVEKEFKKVQL